MEVALANRTMPLRITFLGSGGAFTDYRVNYHNNALIHTSVGPVLIDCGGTACQALRELQIAPQSLAGVIITHVHGDHVGGLEQLIWERYYGGESGPGFKRTAVAATPDVLDDVRRVVEPQVRWFTTSTGEVGDQGWVRLVDAWQWPAGGPDARGIVQAVEIGGVLFSLHATPHVSAPSGGKASYGVRVRSSEAELYFTSDTEFRSDVCSRFPNAQAIFHDCMFYRHFDGTVHTHYSQLLTLPAPVRGRVVLMHHTRVPEGIDPVADGFSGVARRFDTFEIFPNGARLCALPADG